MVGIIADADVDVEKALDGKGKELNVPAPGEGVTTEF